MKPVIFTFGSMFAMFYIFKFSLEFLDFESSVSFFFTCGGEPCPITNLVPLSRAHLEEWVAMFKVWRGDRDLTYNNILEFSWYLEGGDENYTVRELMKIPIKVCVKYYTFQMGIFFIILELYFVFSTHPLHRFCDPQYKTCHFFSRYEVCQ